MSEAANAHEQRVAQMKTAHRNEVDALNARISEAEAQMSQLQQECSAMKHRYENEKCKLQEKEQTLQLLQQQLSRFSLSKTGDSGESQMIESQMSAVFEQFTKTQQSLKAELGELSAERERLVLQLECGHKDNRRLQQQLESAQKANQAAEAQFEQHKKNMCEQLERAHQDIQLRQERSERLIKTFEQRLELRKKQNLDLRQQKETQTAAVAQREAQLKRLNAETEHIKEQLRRCQQTVSNAQSLNEQLLQEKAAFDVKLERKESEAEVLAQRLTRMQSDLAQCIEERASAIGTSKRK